MKLVASEGTQYAINRPEMSIGRDPSNDIYIADPRVSGHHARILQEGNSVIISDTGSTNGTFVNNFRITGPHELHSGDMISLGGVFLTAQDDLPQPPPVTQAWQAGSFQPNPTVFDPNPPAPYPTYPAAQPAYPPQPAYAQPAAYPAPMYSAPQVGGSKDRSLAMVLEILPGLFGFLGIGWLYAGQTGKGLAFLIGNLIYVIFAGILIALTAGIAACITWPIEIGILVFSAVTLNNFSKQHPELFKP